MLKRTTKPLSRRVLIEEGLAKSSKKQHSGNTDKKERKKEKKKNSQRKNKGALWNAEQKKNTTTIARLKKAKEKALKWTSQTGKEPYKNHSEKNRALHNAKKNNKTTK